MHIMNPLTGPWEKRGRDGRYLCNRRLDPWDPLVGSLARVKVEEVVGGYVCAGDIQSLPPRLEGLKELASPEIPSDEL